MQKEAVRSRISCFHSLSLLYEAPQVFFHIPIRDALNHLIFPSVEDELSGNGTITMLRLGAFFFVYQMTVLLRRNFRAVLDLADLAGSGDRVKYYHVELAYGKLQDKYLLLGVG